jgi:FlaA1/EpsC-like NDP-sugar epimerase
MKVLQRILTPDKYKRAFFFLLLDAAIVSLSFYVSFYLRYRFIMLASAPPFFFYWLAFIVALKIGCLAAFRFYNISWGFVSIAEFLTLVKSGLLASAALFTVDQLIVKQWAPVYALPMVVLIIDAVLSYTGIGFLRISKRIYLELLKKGASGRKTLIIGANFKSDRLIKELKMSESGLLPVAIMDDNPMMVGTKINGVSVVPDGGGLGEFIRVNRIETVLINLPDASHRRIKEIFDLLKAGGIEEIKIVPHLRDWNEDIHQIRRIDIEDLLFRDTVHIEFEGIQNYLLNRTVLVTGAGGSIGSEMIQKLSIFGVKRIVALDIDETEIFNLYHRMQNELKQVQKLQVVIGDIRDREKIDWVFRTFRPQIVFHAAAYKHVPLMEDFPEEAVKTNVFGTQCLADACIRHQTEKLVNISTDKAVNPTSVMGATKRMAEMIISALNGGTTRMVSVRFGNVLGSRGSVIPLFLEQIKRGGPVTVTHPDMKRYFMSIPEAVLLVLQASYMGKGGEVFVLNMGEPVKIVDLAESLIRLNNLEPYKDIPVVFSGLRPGEKLYEELLTAEEGTDMTGHSQILVARNGSKITAGGIGEVLKDLERSFSDPANIRETLKKYIPYYRDTSS